MSKRSGESLIEEEPSSAPKEEEKKIKKNFKRRGKASQKKATDAYRARKSTQELEEFERQLIEKYDLYNLDRAKKLEQVIATRASPSDQTAVTLSVTTRGVGFAVAAFYDQAATTWTLAQMWEIATIYQIYRVSLYLLEYTVQLANNVQSEVVYDDNPLEPAYVEGDFAAELATIQVAPSSLVLILGALGKTAHNNSVYHVGFARQQSFDNANEFRTMVIRPTNIRDLLDRAATNRRMAEELRENNSIPGLRFRGGLVANADEVWPAVYDFTAFRKDVKDFKAWVSRASRRMPKGCFPRIELCGIGSPGALVSSYRVNAKIKSEFRSETVEKASPTVQQGKKRKPPRPAVETHYTYRTSIISSERSRFWISDAADHESLVVGAGSLVGEYCGVQTRHPVNAHLFVSVDPVSVLSGVGCIER